MPGSGWSYGTSLSYARELAAYWKDEYDWRAQEAKLNAFEQYTVSLKGIDLHFIHERGAGDDPVPILLLQATGAIGSSFWPYYTRHHGEWIINDLIPEGRRIETPTCYIQFPREIIRPPRSLAERLFNLRRWTVAKSGGHFPALEEPDISRRTSSVSSPNCGTSGMPRRDV